MFLLLSLALFLSGGCGGGGGNRSAESPKSNLPDSAFTEESIQEAQEILIDALKVFNVANKVTVNEFFEGYVSALKRYSQVDSVLGEKKESVYNSFIDVNFKSGFHCRIEFTSEQYQDAFYSEPMEASLYVNDKYRNNDVLGHTTAITQSDIKSFSGANLYKFTDGMWLKIDKGAATDIDSLMHLYDANSTLRINMSLQDLRSLNSYDYIFINVHAGPDNLMMSVINPLDFVLDANTNKDAIERRIKPAFRILFVDETFDENWNPSISPHNDWDFILDGNPEDYLGGMIDNLFSLAVVYPKFFTDYYSKNQLNKPIIFFEACSLLKKSEMSNALIEAGARCVIGYDEDVSNTWGNMTSKTITEELLKGSSVASAIRAAKVAHGDKDRWGKEGKVPAQLVVHPEENAENIFLIGNTLPPIDTGNWIDVADTSWYNANQSVFTIHTEEQLAGIAKLSVQNGVSFSGKTITLGANMDLVEREWTPIRTFEGTINGNNHIIANVRIVKEGTSTVGFIENVQRGKVSHLHLVSVNISGHNNVGGLAGSNTGGEIEFCSVSGNVKGTSGVGLVVGANYEHIGVISYCEARSGQVTGTANFTGGVVGSNYATISNSISYASVQGRTNVGGIAGENYTASGRMINNTARGPVSGTTSVGGVLGLRHSGTIVSGNTFSRSATGRQWGVGSPQSNDGASPIN